MPIIKTLTQSQQDIADKNELVLQVAEAANSMVVILTSVLQKFWALPTPRLLALLNDDVQASISTFELCGILAVGSNQALIALNLSKFSNRAPESRLRADIQFDTATMKFIELPPGIVPASPTNKPIS